MATTVEGLQIGYENLLGQSEKVLSEIDRVSKDLAQARGAVLREVDAFSRARALSRRLLELKSERDALTAQIEQGVL
jgi:hypothetical protein